jgi:hypothetical protein
MRALKLGTLVVLLSALGVPAVVACNSDGMNEREQPGSLKLSLSAVTSSGVRYRLRMADFVVSGPTNATFSTEADPDAETVQLALVAGDYEIELQTGWLLERQTAGTSFEPVEDATLLSPNPQQFSIAADTVTGVVVRFRDADDIVVFGEGTLEVSVEVEQACPTGLTRCGSDCVDLNVDPTHCGACGVACPASAQCTDGACVAECVAPLADCDGNISNGCETNVATSLNNCGACGNVCTPQPFATPACTSGACTIGSCVDGFANCDSNVGNGCELLLKSNPPCGSTVMPPMAGDVPGSALVLSDAAERSVRLRVLEQDLSSLPRNLSVQFTLTAPPGVIYRLEGSCDTCSTMVSGNSSIILGWEEALPLGVDSSRDVFVKVVHVAGSSCLPWTLEARGGIPGPLTCSPL